MTAFPPPPTPPAGRPWGGAPGAGGPWGTPPPGSGPWPSPPGASWPTVQQPPVWYSASAAPRPQNVAGAPTRPQGLRIVVVAVAALVVIAFGALAVLGVLVARTLSQADPPVGLPSTPPVGLPSGTSSSGPAPTTSPTPTTSATAGPTPSATPSPTTSATPSPSTSASNPPPPPAQPTIPRTPTPKLPTVTNKASKGPSILVNNPLYRETPSGRCPPQAFTSSKAAWRKQISRLVTCLGEAWRPAVERAGFAFQPVKTVFYSNSVGTPCGRSLPQFPAFYCTANLTMYFSADARDMSSYYRLAAASFVIHEYFHHVQNLIRVWDGLYHLTEDFRVITRRIELQTFCVTHLVLRTVKGFNVTYDDYQDLAFQWAHTSDPVGHGSTKAQLLWGPRGFWGKTVAACNTWPVKPQWVK